MSSGVLSEFILSSNLDRLLMSTMFLIRTMSLAVCLSSALFVAALSENTQTRSEKELEIRALAMIAGTEREAKRMHRTIERYRVYLDRVEAKIAKGIDEEQAAEGALGRRVAMSNLAISFPPKERSAIWKIVHGTLDLDSFIESDGVADQDEHNPYVEELVVIGSIFDHMPMDPAEFSVEDIRTMRLERNLANKLYREGHYDEAYPLLLDLAKRGFKDSQSRLAYILFNGAETVEKSNLRALGWLGSAAYGDTEPKFRVLFKRYMAEVPEHVRKTVDTVIDGYQRSFAHDEHQNCSTDHNYAFGRVKRTFCRFKLEAIAEACEAGPGGGICWAHAVNTQSE